jgi:hypothetical protein
VRIGRLSQLLHGVGTVRVFLRLSPLHMPTTVKGSKANSTFHVPVRAYS